MSKIIDRIRGREPVSDNKDAEQYERIRHGWRCPRCWEPMVERANHASGELFFGCTKYPVCRGTRDENGQCAEEIGVPPQGWSDEDVSDFYPAFHADMGDR